MAMDYTSVGASNFEVTGPQGQKPAVEFVSVNPTTGDAEYRIIQNFGHVDNGPWQWVASTTAQAVDLAGNKVQGGQSAGSFNVNIPIPTDTTPPVWTTTSVTPTDITTSGQHTVTLSGTYSDA